jgi:hypothetical protein
MTTFICRKLRLETITRLETAALVGRFSSFSGDKGRLKMLVVRGINEHGLYNTIFTEKYFKMCM